MDKIDKVIDYVETLWKKYKEEHGIRIITTTVKNSEYYYSLGRLNAFENIIYFVKKLKWESPEEEETVPYPFMLDGKPVQVGSILQIKGKNDTYLAIRLSTGYRKKVKVVLGRTREPGEIERDIEDLAWPDPSSKKLTVARWAYTATGFPDNFHIRFSDEMTEEQAKKEFGVFVFKVPGSEREIEA